MRCWQACYWEKGSFSLILSERKLNIENWWQSATETHLHNYEIMQINRQNGCTVCHVFYYVTEHKDFNLTQRVWSWPNVQLDLKSSAVLKKFK